MAKIENDLTRNSRPAIIVAGPRTGGTFLTHCLDAHPEMRWERGEPLHPQRRFKLLGLSDAQIVGLLFETPGYHVSGFRALYGELPTETWQCVAAYAPLVIHLTRANVLRQAVSYLINQMAREGRIPLHPQHTFEEPKQTLVHIDPDTLLRTCYTMIAETQIWRALLRETGLTVLELDYADLVGFPGLDVPGLAEPAAIQLCEFLSVPQLSSHAMYTRLRKVNKGPLRAIVENWDEVREAVAASDFDWCLGDE